jgi:hypothetical protein
MRRAVQMLLFVLVAFRPVLQAQPSGALQQGGNDAQVEEGAAGANWGSYNGTLLGWRYSSLDQISRTNVKKLEVRSTLLDAGQEKRVVLQRLMPPAIRLRIRNKVSTPTHILFIAREGARACKPSTTKIEVAMSTIA